MSARSPGQVPALKQQFWGSFVSGEPGSGSSFSSSSFGAVLSAGSPVQVPALQAAVWAVLSAGSPVQVPALQAAVQQIAAFLLIMALDRYSSKVIYNGYFSGIMEFQEDNSSNKQLAVINSNESVTFTFDDNRNNVTVISPLLISPFPTNNHTSSCVHSGELLLEYGSDNNNNPDYKSIEEFTTKINKMELK